MDKQDLTYGCAVCLAGPYPSKERVLSHIERRHGVALVDMPSDKELKYNEPVEYAPTPLSVDFATFLTTIVEQSPEYKERYA